MTPTASVPNLIEARDPRQSQEIRTIFWDIGGVILTNGWDLNQRARVLSSLGVDLQAYEAVHDSGNYFWERGLASAEDFFRETVLPRNSTSPSPNSGPSSARKAKFSTPSASTSSPLSRQPVVIASPP